MTNPLFTIITCTYNAEHTLERTIKSVDGQTYPDIEHLIIDGASKDGTLEIAATSERARVVSEPDKGLYDAMNKGISLAKGAYIIFLNAGDCFHRDDTLSEVASMLHKWVKNDIFDLFPEDARHFVAVEFGDGIHLNAVHAFSAFLR